MKSTRNKVCSLSLAAVLSAALLLSCFHPVYAEETSASEVTAIENSSETAFVDLPEDVPGSDDSLPSEDSAGAETPCDLSENPPAGEPDPEETIAEPDAADSGISEPEEPTETDPDPASLCEPSSEESAADSGEDLLSDAAEDPEPVKETSPEQPVVTPEVTLPAAEAETEPEDNPASGEEEEAGEAPPVSDDEEAVEEPAAEPSEEETGVQPAQSSAALIPLSDAFFPHDSMAYTGTPRTQTNAAVVIAKSGQDVIKLERGTDYTIKYKNNINAGTATIFITGKGRYTGTLEKTFEITRVPLQSMTLKHESMVYKGRPRTQNLDTIVQARVGGKLITLQRWQDYSISYENNVDAGTAVMIVKGKGNYRGTLRKSFKITRVPLKSASIPNQTMQHTGKPRTQTNGTKVYASVDGSTRRLTLGKDYTISYLHNYYGKAKMIIRGKGNYSGTIKKTFTITGAWGSNATSTDSPRSKEYQRLLNNQPINPQDPTQTVFGTFASMINGSFVIPGIRRTHIVDRNGNHLGCPDMVIQGTCTAGDYLIISAYCSAGEHNSVLYILKNGEYLETICLTKSGGAPLLNHVGGLAYLDGNVYIAGDSDNCVYAVPMEKIKKNLGHQDARRSKVLPAFYTSRSASFLTAFEKKLYVGTFYMDEYRNASGLSTLQAYDPLTGSASGAPLTLATNKAQGAVFVKNSGSTYLLASASYGRGNTSELILSRLNSNRTLTEKKRILLPNMSEELAIRKGKLYIGFESGARYYTDNGLFDRIRPLDRIISMDVLRLIS